MQPTIMLTGLTGQLGSELWHSLQTLGRVVPCVHPAERQSFAFPAETLDLTDVAAIERLVLELRPQLIVNPAAYTAVDKAEQDRDVADAVNHRAVAAFGRAARSVGAAICHYSTDYVLSGSGDRPFAEDAVPAPLGVYGRTKLAGEYALKAAEVPHLILRTSWVYGAHGHNFVKTILRLAREREELKIVDDQIGAPTSARFLSELSAQILAQAKGDFVGFIGRNSGIYHAVNGGEVSWHGFATSIVREAAALGVPLVTKRVIPIPTRDYPTPAERPRNSRLSTAKVTERFGLVSPHWELSFKSLLPQIVAATA